jgi:hypothetical protein
MKSTDTLTTIFRHHLWANVSLFERCADLTAEQLDATRHVRLDPGHARTHCPGRITCTVSAPGNGSSAPKTPRP